jgi:hypothetical protein
LPAAARPVGTRSRPAGILGAEERHLIAPSLPLLHVVQTAGKVTAVDPGVLALALLTLAAVLAWQWAPRPLTLGRVTRMPVMRVTLAALLFFAVLPSVVPYDHLLPGITHDDSTAATAVHATHCHISPGSCADAPLAAGPGQLIFSEPLVIAPAMLAVLLIFASPALAGVTHKPDTRPPLA